MFKKSLCALVVVFAMCLVSVTWAGEMSYSSDGFSINYNDTWSLENVENGISIKSPSMNIEVGVSVAAVKKKVKAADVMKQAAKDGGWKNEMSAKASKISAKELKKIGADTGALGAYTIGEDENKIKLVLAIYTLGKKVYTVGIAVGGEPTEEEMADIELMSKSFKLFK